MTNFFDAVALKPYEKYCFDMPNNSPGQVRKYTCMPNNVRYCISLFNNSDEKVYRYYEKSF